MTRWLFVPLALAGCGRLGFDGAAPSGDAPAIDDDHDEDGDGVRDAVDTCPHVAGPQLDGDGDGVGDLCDPEPGVARQYIARFASLRPGDQPYALPTDGVGGTWTPQADALHFDGTYGELKLPFPLVDARVAMGIDILRIIGGTGVQHQLALALANDTDAPHAFVELNESDDVAEAAVTQFDGSSYTSIVSAPLPDNVHTGPAVLQVTAFGPPRRMQAIDAGWPNELYNLGAPTPDYTGTAEVHFNVNNLEIAIRYVVVISTR